MFRRVSTRWWMTLFSPGHSPPHVTTAARTFVGLKWSDARGPEAKKILKKQKREGDIGDIGDPILSLSIYASCFYVCDRCACVRGSFSQFLYTQIYRRAWHDDYRWHYPCLIYIQYIIQECPTYVTDVRVCVCVRFPHNFATHTAKI